MLPSALLPSSFCLTMLQEIFVGYSINSPQGFTFRFNPIAWRMPELLESC